MKCITLLAPVLMMTAPVIRAADCTTPRTTKSVAPADVIDVTVDASTGHYTGRKQFRTHQQVRLVIENKNPFLYKYTVKENVKVIAEEDLKLFLGLLGLPEVAATKDVEEKVDKIRKRFERSAIANKPVEKLLQAIRRARKESEQTRTDFKKPKSAWDKATAILNADGQKAVTLADAANELLSSLEVLPDLAELEKAIEALRRAAIVVEELAGDRKSAEYKLAHTVLTDVLPKREDELKGYQDALAKLKAAKTTVGAVCSDSEAFVGTTMLSQDSDPRINEVIVEKTTLDEAKAKTTTVASVKLQFGSARFTLSGGLVGSPLGRTQYQIAQGFVHKRDGSIARDTKVENGVTVETTEKFGSIIGKKEDSRSRLLPIVLLHANLYDCDQKPSVGFHLSAGVTAKNDNKGTDVEYLFGPSVSFLEKHLFLTVGAYAAKQQTLADDLFLGAPADKLTVADIATKRLRWGWGFAISYKLR